MTQIDALMNNWKRKGRRSKPIGIYDFILTDNGSHVWHNFVAWYNFTNLAFKGLTQVQKMACHSLRITQQELQETHKLFIRIIWSKFIIYTKHP